MCGIAGALLNRPCEKTLLDMLDKMEYRGYDSCGIGTISENQLEIRKMPGSTHDYQQRFFPNKNDFVGIGHTRWATHGKVNEINSHPHADNTNTFAVVHNGVIENYKELKQLLTSKGFTFQSETDTEIIPNLIYYYYHYEDKDFLQSVRETVALIEGAYAIAVISKLSPKEMIVSRRGSPLIVGRTPEGYLVASDIGALAPYTNDLWRLEDGDVAVLYTDLSAMNQSQFQTENLELEEISKGNYPYFMLKEIMEQSDVVERCIAGRVTYEGIKLGGIEKYKKQIRECFDYTFTGHGSSYHAALLGKQIFDNLLNSGRNKVEYSSELNPQKLENNILISLSQSGETGDLVDLLRKVPKPTLKVGITNSVGSNLSQLTDCGIYLRAGKEIGVAATKTFACQLVTLLMLAHYLKGDQDSIKRFLRLSEKINNTLSLNDEIFYISKRYDKHNWFFIGNGYNYPLALEAALKMKEISQVPALGCLATELKHGTLSLIDTQSVIVILFNQEDTKAALAAYEIKARGGQVIGIGSNDEYAVDCHHYIQIPSENDEFETIYKTIVTQLMAYHMAILRGCNPDKPRNLAKSVTVK